MAGLCRAAMNLRTNIASKCHTLSHPCKGFRHFTDFSCCADYACCKIFAVNSGFINSTEFMWAHGEKSNKVRSGERAGQATDLLDLSSDRSDDYVLHSQNEVVPRRHQSKGMRVDIDSTNADVPVACFKVCHGSLYAVTWLVDEPREFNLPTLPQMCITYLPEKLPSKHGVHSEEYLPIRTVMPVVAGM
ncbi:hypothetical protein ANN_14093 [Periplaneta americana]|uniref:Uncharacterized protein n=1 Tax=Periplaneta americana TaxID=6978 RepID=A0ABQ8SWD3_PERAM|nr:hypothetical protein ANN_14093 [Periplaneta americana]